MKSLRFFVLAVLVLVLTLGAAPAQAARPTMGYIALVTRHQPGVPTEVQARMEFDRLAPALLAAQQSGYLAEFKPELHAGIVMLRFTSGGAASLAAGMLDRPVYSDVHQALRAVPHERPAQPAGGVSPAVISAHFYLFLYESCFSGSVPVDAHVIAVLKDNAGNLLAKRQFNEQDDGASDGEFWTCFDWSSFHELFPGYRVTFKVYGAPGGALLGTFNAPVPNIRFTGLNKAQAQVSGTGPAGKAFTLWWSQHRLNAAGTWAGNTVNGTITPGGTWFADVSTGSIRGGAQLYLRVEQTPAVSVDLSMHAPNIYCQLRGPYCSIYGFPLQTLTIQLKKGATTYTRSGQADSRGWLGVPFRTATGAPIVVQPGDMVAGTNVAWYTQPALTFNAFNFAGDIISGTAPPSKYFWIWVHAYGWGPDWWHGYWKGSSAAGAFAVDTTADYNLVSTETSEAEIWFMHPATGNETDFTRVYAP